MVIERDGNASSVPLGRGFRADATTSDDDGVARGLLDRSEGHPDRPARLTLMGKASRRKKISPSAAHPAYRAPVPFRERPFEGIPAEVQLVAMREFIPCATMAGRTTQEHGAVDFDFATLLPDGHAAMVRGDGRILVGLQTRFHSGDLSHDAGGALAAAIARQLEGEEGMVSVDVRDPAPRLQDMLDSAVVADLQVLDDFEYWFDPEAEVTPEMEEALRQNRDDVIPTAEVPGVPGMYWCRMNRTFIRYVTDYPESQLFAALARLQVGGRARIGKNSRFVGAFRACGLAIPVFEIDEGARPEDVAEDAQALASALSAALEITEALTVDERRARDGLISRQVTIR